MKEPSFFVDLTPAIGSIKGYRIDPIMNTPDIYSDNPVVTREYQIAVMQAYVQGKIEFRPRNSDYNWKKCAVAANSDGTHWDWSIYTYRISPSSKPKKTVPMERDDYPPFFWIQCNGSTSALTVLGVSPQGITIPNCAWQPFPADARNGCNHYTWKQLAEHWQYSTDRKTWLPCTKEVVA